MALAYELHAIIMCRSWVNDEETSSQFNTFLHPDSVHSAEVQFRHWREKIKMQIEGKGINPKMKRYYILFVDFNLSESTGFDLLKRLKEDPYLKYAYVVIVNDRWNAIDEKRCRDQDVYMCVASPLLPLNVLQVRDCLLKVDEAIEQRSREMQQLHIQPQSGSSLSKTEMALTFKLHAIIICRSWVDDIPTTKLFHTFAHLDSVRNAEVYFSLWEEMIKIQKEGTGPKEKECYILFVDFVLDDDSSGFDLLARFKENPYLKWVNVVIMNENWNDMDKQRCSGKRVYACFDDPLSPLKVEQVRNYLLLKEKRKQLGLQKEIQIKHKTVAAEFKFHGLIISTAKDISILPVRHLFSTLKTSESVVGAHYHIKEWESKGETMFQGGQLTAQVKEKEVFILFIDCDFEQPSPSGFDLLKHFKKTPHLRHIHFVMLSIAPPWGSDVFDRSMAEGAFTSIDHPLTVTKVEQIIQQIGRVAQVTL